MSKKLMIQAGNKTFFTWNKNLPMLIQFAKDFKAKISEVEVDTQHLVSLEEIASKFCDQNLQQDPVLYKLLDTIYPKPGGDVSKTREKMLADAKVIRSFIKEELLNNGKVTMKDLKTKFKSLDLTDACLSNHMTNVRKELAKNDIQVTKAGRGIWSRT